MIGKQIRGKRKHSKANSYEMEFTFYNVSANRFQQMNLGSIVKEKVKQTSKACLPFFQQDFSIAVHIGAAEKTDSYSFSELNQFLQKEFQETGNQEKIDVQETQEPSIQINYNFSIL